MRNWLMCRRSTALAAAGVAVVTLAAACSAAGSGGSAAGSTTSGGGTVHFAAAGAYSGIQAAVGAPILEGTKAAAAVINANGGILGKKLVIDAADTKGDPADAVTALHQDIALNHPSALIGPASLEIHGAQPVFDQAKIPDGWNGGSAEFDHNKDPLLWRCNPSDSQEGVAIAAYAIKKGYKRAAMLFTNVAASQAFEPIISNAYNKLGGKVVDTQNLTPGLSDYRTEVSKILASKPDVIFSQMEPSTSATVMKNFQQLGGLHIPIVGTDLMAGSDVIKAIGPAFDASHIAMVQGSSELTGSAAAFATAYKKANGHAPIAGGGYSYDCTILFALAATYAKSTSPAAIEGAVMKVSNPPGIKVGDYATGVKDIKAGKKINYDGVSGPLDYNAFHNVIGPWDVVVASGDKAGDVKTVLTLQPAEIQAALNGTLK
ncbi:MAG: ABC transporter substrate-binding protein [Nocardiopsaceae bacterium]|nr:ABC transporter substrate-binding protein [Nocardiopsaceae bacterium]